MARFSPTDVAFEGFRFVRERPRTVLAWTGFYILIAFVVAAIVAGLAGPRWAELRALSQATVVDQKMLDTLRDVGPAGVLALLVGAILTVGLQVAMLRAFLGSPTSRWGGIRFAEDELRLLAVYALILVAFTVAGVAVGLGGAQIAALGLTVPFALLAMAVLIYLAVRLSLAPVVAVAEKKIDFKRAWTLTRGRFWPLLGAFALALGVTVIIYLLVMGLFAALMGAGALATGGGLADVGRAMGGNFDGVSPLVVGLDVLLSLAQAWLAVLAAAVQTAVMVEAYRAFSRA